MDNPSDPLEQRFAVSVPTRQSHVRCIPDDASLAGFREVRMAHADAADRPRLTSLGKPILPP